jgi:ribonuclease VapC
MIIDSSALAAVVFKEEDRRFYIEALSEPRRKYMSSVNFLEIGMVAEVKKGDAGAKALRKVLFESEIEIVAFDSGQAEIALDAWRRYGKGRHKAGLNFGDCAAYALAKTSNEPLLFKGSNFSETDLTTISFDASEEPCPT